MGDALSTLTMNELE